MTMTENEIGRTPDDLIYRSRTLHSIPHRLRVRQIITELKKVPLQNPTYADVGCGGGSVTYRIVKAITPRQAAGYDSNPELTDAAGKAFHDISFRVWNLAEDEPPAQKFELVTCFETLEHIEKIERSLENLLKITDRYLLVTVPNELGIVGAAKFGAKAVLGRSAFTAEHEGSKFEYFVAALTHGNINKFRVSSNNGFWESHTGFDYRRVDRFFASTGLKVVTTSRGWNRFYLAAVRS